MDRSQRKTVLLVTPDRRNQVLYETVLARHFNIAFRSTQRVDAVVVDIPTLHGSVDLRWLESLKMPTVVLTPEDQLPLPSSSTRSVLTYPVNGDRLLGALARLGVEAAAE